MGFKPRTFRSGRMKTDKMRGSQRLLFSGSGKGDRTAYSLCGGDEQGHWRS